MWRFRRGKPEGDRHVIRGVFRKIRGCLRRQPARSGGGTRRIDKTPCCPEPGGLCLLSNSSMVARTTHQKPREPSFQIAEEARPETELPRPAMKETGRRTDNQPGAVRTSVLVTRRRAVPSPVSCRSTKTCDGRADNQPEAARTIVSNDVRSSVPRDFLRPAMKDTGRRTDNQPGAVRTSVLVTRRRAVPSPVS